MNKSSTAVAEQRAKGRIVVIVGVHRSGTSLTTRALGALGVRLGDSLLPGRSDNPAGFFEHTDILEQTTEIDRLLGLAPFGGGAILPPPDTAWDRSEFRGRVESLKEIVEREVSRAPGELFGFKDPRTTYLLPVWRQVFAELDVDPVYVLALRNPADAIASMMRRNISHAHAETIWTLHMSQALCHLREAPQAIVDYERWFAEPVTQAREIADALGLANTVDESELEAALGGAVRKDLRHHAGQDVPDSISGRLYRAIQDYRKGGQAWSDVRETAATACEMGRMIDPVLAELRDKPRELQEQLQDRVARYNRLRERLQALQLDRSARSGSASDVDEVLPRHPAPYSVEFPSLNRIKAAHKAPPRGLKVCIATEDIVGPIRNGGIGTTYTDLSFMLAEAGHETTILYLRGNHCEDHTIDHWVDWYAQKGVTFKPAELPEDTTSPSQRWLRPMYALYLHLREHHYDLVHVSEWRGSAYMALCAKHQGLAFRDTVFCVKTSSPWLWNREHGLHTIDHTSDMLKMFAERRSVELADLVVGGSAHLLRWMLDHGYRLPTGRTFVQPNVVKPVDLPDQVVADRPAYGSRVAVKEVVFFGRLEHRKGLDIFCEAVNLLLRRGVKLPPITFLGKYGARIPTHAEMSVQEYIEHQVANWPMKTRVISTYGQADALTYLHGEGRLAVMPSVIENSTMAVYETTQYAIPFIASNVGGTPELVASEHRKAVLVKPHPVPLADKLSEAVEQGGFVAEPSFNNDTNLATWLNFHARLSTIIDSEGWPPRSLSEAATAASGPAGAPGEPTPGEPAPGEPAPAADTPVHTSVCLVLDQDRERIEPTLDVLERSADKGTEVVVVADGNGGAHTRRWLKSRKNAFRRAGIGFAFFETEHFGLAAARNFAAKKANGEYLCFLSPSAHPTAEAIASFRHAAENGGLDVLTSFYGRMTRAEHKKGADPRTLVMSMAGDAGFHFYSPDWVVGPALYVRRRAFQELGGFTTDYRVPAADEEFVAGAMLANKAVETVPHRLANLVVDYPEPERYNNNATYMRTIRPYISAAPLCYQTILMGARTLEVRRKRLLDNNAKFRQQRDEHKEQLEFYKALVESKVTPDELSIIKASAGKATSRRVGPYRVGWPERYALSVLNRLRRLAGK